MSKNCYKGKNSAKLGIPPRWLNCPRRGQLISGKFIPFKTPLSSDYDDQVPLANRFPPEMLISSMKANQTSIGLWIDLTNTDRFYNKENIEKHGIKYVKLHCRGHGECPSEEQTQTFIHVCKTYISKEPLGFIGVHCTHGFNRSGFLIIACLVEYFDWSVDAAVSEFKQARPPGIYKADYLLELYTRYGDKEDTPPAPPLPEWCNESDDVDDDGTVLDTPDGTIQNNANDAPRKRRREFNKKDPTFMEGVPGVTAVTAQHELSRIQAKCQDMCHWKGSGFPGCQPVSMDAENLNLLMKKPYKVSWKADGTRYMMLIEGENSVFFIDRDNAVFKVANLWFPHRKDPSRHIVNTLLDGEMIIDKVDETTSIPRYLIYDIIQYEGLQVGDADFDRRLLCISKEIIQPRHEAMKDGRIDRNKEPFSIRAKTFWDVSQAKSILAEKFTRNVTHDIDGLIFQPAIDPYATGRCFDVLKWKPSNLNSVDFKLVITRENREGYVGGLVGQLYVGGADRPFSEIKFTNALKPYDKKIIECKFEKNRWQFLRERTDKSFPNSLSTAMAVCKSIKNPVTKEKLLEFIEVNRWDKKRSNSGYETSDMEPMRKKQR